MARSLISSNADVSTPAGEHLAVRFEHRQGRPDARVTERRGGATLASHGPVKAITAEASRTYLVEFDDGESWTVKVRKGCGCGRR